LPVVELEEDLVATEPGHAKNVLALRAGIRSQAGTGVVRCAQRPSQLRHRRCGGHEPTASLLLWPKPSPGKQEELEAH
jgi:hypothetical protein